MVGVLAGLVTAAVLVTPATTSAMTRNGRPLDVMNSAWSGAANVARVSVKFAKQRRILVDDEKFITAVDVFLQDPGSEAVLRRLRLTKGDTVVLDLEHGTGTPDAFFGVVPGQLHWQTEQTDTLEPRGYYRLSVALDRGPQFDASFVVDFEMPAAAPEVLQPKSLDVFTTAEPVIRFTPFVVLDAGQFARHRAQLFINANPGAQATTVFGRDLGNPAAGFPVDVQVSTEPPLDDREYLAFVAQQDSVSAGMLEVVREVGTSVHFFVRTDAGSLPGVPGVSQARLSFRRFHRLPTDDHVFRIRVDLDADDPGAVTAMRLTDPAGVVILGEALDNCQLGDEVQTTALIMSCDVTGEEPGGLYSLEIQPRDGAAVIFPVMVGAQPWASADPVITIPRNGQVFDIARPTFVAPDFTSPEHRPFETRLTSFSINFHPTNDPPFRNVWDALVLAPAPETFTLGDGIAAAAPPLETGEYRFQAGHIDQSPSGVVDVEREAATVACFLISLDGSSPICRTN